MPDRAPSKAQLRRELRQRRHSLSTQSQLAAARAVASQCLKLPGFSHCHRIALYLAQDGEIDTTELSTSCRAQGKQLFLPVIGSDNSLSFANWQPDGPLHNNRYGIPEPPEEASRCPADQLDIVFMPLVGWDRTGGRLGMGGGFYDRSLAGVNGPIRVGLAHAIQELEEIPREAWDICLDFVVTETTLHHCQGAR
jgi:5-formyltetrahydrofolate cyclo-ligase